MSDTAQFVSPQALENVERFVMEIIAAVERGE
jgi:hypothetical protein